MKFVSFACGKLSMQLAFHFASYTNIKSINVPVFPVRTSPESIEQMIDLTSPVRNHSDRIGFSVRRTEPVHFILWS